MECLFRDDSDLKQKTIDSSLDDKSSLAAIQKLGEIISEPPVPKNVHILIRSATACQAP